MILQLNYGILVVTNVLVTLGIFLISDFGLARDNLGRDRSMTLVGTVNFFTSYYDFFSHFI